MIISLRIKFGDLGVKRVSSLAMSAFLASAASALSYRARFLAGTVVLGEENSG